MAAQIRVRAGTLLINAAEHTGLPVGRGCGRTAHCGDCRMTIIQGAENLSALTEKEKLLHRIEKFADNERASCQTKVYGDVQATAAYW